MRSLSFLTGLLAATSVCGVTVTSYITSESPIAKAGLLANIGPSGSKSSGASPGVVIASPQTDNPNYLYSWVRDSSLVFKTLIDQHTLGLDTSLRTTIDAFVLAESVFQQTANPSGTVSTGGLGEPKFNINLTAFTGAWGRPQRDGPALRSTALITYANWLIKNGNTTFVTSTLFPMITLDLNYVANNWNQSTFDLWEEINSSSFWTTATQHRALREGIALANTLKSTSNVSLWTAQAGNLLCFLQSFWDPSGGYITANTGGGRSGIDSNTVLASIHTFDINAGCDATTFQPCSDKALSNLLVYVNSFRSIYSINSGITATAGIATGRYPEDVYQGGNPWYLCTFAVAEQLYDALYTWSTHNSLSITATSLPFFQTFSSSAAVGTYASTTSTYTTLTTAIKAYADGFVAVNAQYTPTNGGLAEQYSKSNGAPLSAADLTWSYASAITVFEARANTAFASWGASGLTVPSGTCQGGPPVPMVSVTFNVDATTVLGENIYLTGSVSQLSTWSTTSAIAMSAANYPIWSVTVSVPASTNIQYKYIRINNGAVTWESDPNMQITTPATGTYTENDTWR